MDLRSLDTAVHSSHYARRYRQRQAHNPICIQVQLLEDCHCTITVSVAVRIWPALSCAVYVSWCDPAVAANFIFTFSVRLAAVVAVVVPGAGFRPPAGDGGVTVTFPVNPPVRVMFRVAETLVPTLPLTDGSAKLMEKSGPTETPA